MAGKSNDNCNTYGPDLSVHEKEAREIAELGLRCMKGKGATGAEADSSGPSASKNDLESLK